MKIREWFNLIIWIVVFQTIGFLLGMLTEANLDSWYQGLNKSALTPPGYVFSIVWSILYTLLAIIGWKIWRDRKHTYTRQLIPLFFIQLVMNWAWTPLFFQLHWLGFSFIWITIMVLLNGIMILNVKNKKIEMALALIPYWFWLVFAAYLNGVIWFLN